MLAPYCDLEVWSEDYPIPKHILKEKVKGIQGLISMLTDPIDSEVLSGANELSVIANFGVGYDNINVPLCTMRGIRVGNTPDVLTDATADLTFALLLSLARRIPEGISFVKNGQWVAYSPTLLLGKDLFQKTLGIIGFGRIGQAVAKRAIGFGMRVIYTGPSRKPEIEKEIGAECVFFNELLERSDFISLHCPLNAKTVGLIGARQFSVMKKEVIIINTARGKIIETEALIEALHKDQIYGAGLDVTDPEPLPGDHPLLSFPRCIVVPHVGSATGRTRGKVSEMSALNIIAGISHKRLPFPVNDI
jgi:glyoxylate reductase